MMELAVIRQDEESHMNAIIASQGEILPAVIEDILPIISFTHLKAQTFRDLVNRTKKIEDQKELNQMALKSGQRYAQAALFAEAKLGEMLGDLGGGLEQDKNTGLLQPTEGAIRRMAVEAEQGITVGQSKNSKIIAKAKADGTMDEVIKEAEEKGDIPSKAKVISAYKLANYSPKKQAKTDIKSVGEFAFSAAESLSGIVERVRRFAPHREQIAEDTIAQIVNNAKEIIELLEGNNE